MNRLVVYAVAAAALSAAPSLSSATTLMDQTNLPAQTNTPVSLTFTAGSTSTELDFAGYQVPSSETLTDILLTLTGGSTNLLGQTFAFTPAPCGSLANQYGPGANGTNNLAFAGVCEGSYDTFSQTVGTAIGGSYTLSFLLSNSDANQPSGLRITASDAVGNVPEPATWAMMLLGFGGMGLFLRYGRKNTAFAH